MMHLPRSLAAAHTPEFLEILCDEWPKSHWPLEQFLTHGGWPESPQLLLRTLRDEATHCVCLLTVDFTEQCPAACPASARSERRIGYFRLEIRKGDAFATVVED